MPHRNLGELHQFSQLQSEYWKKNLHCYTWGKLKWVWHGMQRTLILGSRGILMLLVQIFMRFLAQGRWLTIHRQYHNTLYFHQLKFQNNLCSSVPSIYGVWRGQRFYPSILGGKTEMYNFIKSQEISFVNRSLRVKILLSPWIKLLLHKEMF